MRQQIHAHYTGRVQGVGFRFTVRGIAEKLKIHGWVKNLPNGGVEVVAEAEEPVIADFLSQVYAYFSRYIHDVKVEYCPETGEFQDFKILF